MKQCDEEKKGGALGALAMTVELAGCVLMIVALGTVVIIVANALGWFVDSSIFGWLR
jgi:hypothetical protein